MAALTSWRSVGFMGIFSKRCDVVQGASSPGFAGGHFHWHVWLASLVTPVLHANAKKSVVLMVLGGLDQTDIKTISKHRRIYENYTQQRHRHDLHGYWHSPLHDGLLHSQAARQGIQPGQAGGIRPRASRACCGA